MRPAARRRRAGRPPADPTGRTSRSRPADDARRRPRGVALRHPAARRRAGRTPPPRLRSQSAPISPVATDIRSVASTPGSSRNRGDEVAQRRVEHETGGGGDDVVRPLGTEPGGAVRSGRHAGRRAVALAVDARSEHGDRVGECRRYVAALPRRWPPWRDAGRRARGASSRNRRTRRAAKRTAE